LEGHGKKKFGIFYDHLVFFGVVWFFLPNLVDFIKKKMATLPTMSADNGLRLG
jgi:hypothetical protein